MADEHKEKVLPPFLSHNFAVEVNLTGISDTVCSAAFSECTGLEMTMEPKTIREGGNNVQKHHLVGSVSYGTLNLKRGMTSNIDLWKWFEATQEGLAGRRLRADADILIYSSEAAKQDVVANFRITGCLPTKLKLPSFNAKDGEIAVEEMEIVYETLELKGL